MVEDVLDTFDLVLLNDGSLTFLRGPSYYSAWDLTFFSLNISSGITWRTDIEVKGSDHLPILISHEHRRLTTFTNWQLFCHLNTASIDANHTLDEFIYNIQRTSRSPQNDLLFPVVVLE